MREHAMTPARIAALIKDVTDLVAQSEVEREVIETVLRATFLAIERGWPDAPGELQELVDAFIPDPNGKDIIARLGAMPRDRRLPDH